MLKNITVGKKIHKNYMLYVIMILTLLILFLQLSYSMYIPVVLDGDDEIIFYFGRRGFIIPSNATDNLIVLKKSPEPSPYAQ